MFSALQMVEWLEPEQVTDDAYSMQQNIKQTATAKKNAPYVSIERTQERPSRILLHRRSKIEIRWLLVEKRRDRCRNFDNLSKEKREPMCIETVDSE